uniref:Uncharacterized protein n=1 Tax=Alexandrium monilatum TaxID=311494 RepID=A0A7S4VL84_9DINO
MKRKASDGPVPVLQAQDVTFEAFSKAYAKHQVVLVRRCLTKQKDTTKPPGSDSRVVSPLTRRRRKIDLGVLRRLFARHPKVVRRAFNMEQAPKASSAAVGTDGVTELLGRKKSPAGPWYASFVVQRSRGALAAFLQALPMVVPPFLQKKGCRGFPAAKHSDAVWVFFGQNPQARPLQGRPEHTDAIAHSGTWHLQLRGSKVWVLRPTAELRRSARPLRGVGRVRVRCREGDLLCVNTRLWWHSTRIPGRCPLSLSVARDMYLDGTRPTACDMTNVDGHFATRNIPRGTVVFSEEDAPDLELPRKPDANLALAEGPDGGLLVVAMRRIAAGEWFSLAESEDES